MRDERAKFRAGRPKSAAGSRFHPVPPCAGGNGDEISGLNWVRFASAAAAQTSQVIYLQFDMPFHIWVRFVIFIFELKRWSVKGKWDCERHPRRDGGVRNAECGARNAGSAGSTPSAERSLKLGLASVLRAILGRVHKFQRSDLL